jgi:hypothetical protein
MSVFQTHMNATALGASEAMRLFLPCTYVERLKMHPR